jgi:glycosyltransferase involved in cell wall biosynthesis
MIPLISFAITTKNEGPYLRALLDQLIPYCERTGNELVILDDYSEDAATADMIVDTLELAGKLGSKLSVGVAYRNLNGDFAAHKNHLNRMCTGKYIFQVDADETLHPELLENLHDLLSINEHVDLFLIPRVNIVNGLTEEDIKRWGWRVNEKGWVVFPDYQTRLYRNSPDIKWEGKVHERIGGHKTMTPLPAEEEWSLYHIKDIQRQRKQNDFYSTIGR